VNSGDRIFVGLGIVCAFAIIMLGYQSGNWVIGLTMALALSPVWVTPWLWLRFFAYGFSIAPADPDEVAAFHSAARLVLRIGIPVWLASIAYIALPIFWDRSISSWILAASQVTTPAIAVWLGFRAKTANKKSERDTAAAVPPQADPSSSRTP
jgi:hypothetical protein